LGFAFALFASDCFFCAHLRKSVAKKVLLLVLFLGFALVLTLLTTNY